jgi:hypothetical protein
VDTIDRFEAFYNEQLEQTVRLPNRIESCYSIEACLKTTKDKEVYLLTSKTKKGKIYSAPIESRRSLHE